MKFTVDHKALAKLVGQIQPESVDFELALSACRSCVFIEFNQTVAGLEAVVTEDGLCVISFDAFRQIVSSIGEEDHLTIEASDAGLCINGFGIAVKQYSATVPTDLREVEQCGIEIATATKEASAPMIEAHQNLEFKRASGFMSDAEGYVIQGIYPALSFVSPSIERIIRALFFLRQVKPAMMIGLTRALHAFLRLPSSTEGVDVHIQIHRREELPVGYRNVGHYVSIAERTFEVGHYHFGCEGEWSKESHNIVYSLAWAWSDVMPEENDWDDESLGTWVHDLHAFVMDGDASRLVLTVKDMSDPDCLLKDGI